MLRLRFAAPMPSRVERGKPFRVELQLCNESGAVHAVPQHAHTITCSLLDASLLPLTGASLLAQQPKRALLAPDGRASFEVTVLESCNKVLCMADPQTRHRTLRVLTPPCLPTPAVQGALWHGAHEYMSPRHYRAAVPHLPLRPDARSRRLNGGRRSGGKRC